MTGLYIDTELEPRDGPLDDDVLDAAVSALTLDTSGTSPPPISSSESIHSMASHVKTKSHSSISIADIPLQYSSSIADSSYLDENSSDESDDDNEDSQLLRAARTRQRDYSPGRTDLPRGRLSQLYRSMSWGGAMVDISASPRISSATAHLISSYIAASNTHHHRGKSSDSTVSGRRRSLFLPNMHEMRAQYLIGSTESPYDWASMLVDSELLRKMSYKRRKFYEAQNELIGRYMEIDDLLDSEISRTMIEEYSQEHAHSRRKTVPANIDEEGQAFLTADAREEYSGIVTLAIMVNLLINVFLLAGKTTIVLLTNSISVIASLVDSALDFLCTSIIWLSTSMVENSSATTRFNYPVGRTRLEPIGVLIFSVIIIVSFFQVAVEAVQRLYKGPREPVELGLPSFIIMSMAVILKLFAWIWCRSINSSAVQALAQDAMSDIVFNLLSICFPVTGFFFKFWWLDPLGALLLSIYIMLQWVDTTFEHVRHLTGVSGDSVDKQVITYLCIRFAESIRQVTSINIYHAGDRLHAEVDVVVDDKLTLRDTHDLGEALQYAIETLPMVERAFVHIDYRNDNYAGHIQR